MSGLAWLRDIPILPYMIREAGCLDIDVCPDCWERNAHLERYAFACEALNGVRVLDYGCGVGYGAEMLAKAGNTVTACDESGEALAIASFRRGDMACFVAPEAISGRQFDATVAFEVLEHLGDPEGFLYEMARKSRHLILSTPIVPTMANNPWHKHDFTVDQLRDMVEKRFTIKCEWFQMRPWRKEPSYMVIHGASKA